MVLPLGNGGFLPVNSSRQALSLEKFAEQLEKHRAMWLDGYRTYLGFAVIVATKRSPNLTAG